MEIVITKEDCLIREYRSCSDCPMAFKLKTLLKDETILFAIDEVSSMKDRNKYIRLGEINPPFYV